MLDLFSVFRRSKGAESQAPKPSRAKTPRVFISYRRLDSLAYAGRILDRLSAKYGSGNVFMDIDAIPVGSDFGSVVVDELRQCNVVFAIIGPSWLGSRDHSQSRINDP